MTRHDLATGDMYYDPPLVASANSTWFRWQEEDQAQLELGFWNIDAGTQVTLHVNMPWDDVEERVGEQGQFDMWLQSAHWQPRVEQTLCKPDTVFADPEAMWSAQQDRGPKGAFFSQDTVLPKANMIGTARVRDTAGPQEGVPVFAAARPSAATPVWWMLQPGDIVDVLDRAGDFVAVAIPTNGITHCWSDLSTFPRPTQAPVQQAGLRPRT